ncbi:uncharacterized, partial [Tachysurus ichikawai]
LGVEQDDRSANSAKLHTRQLRYQRVPDARGLVSVVSP